ncbi:hypothetical protein AGIG_G24984 [Arapaima gigas]
MAAKRVMGRKRCAESSNLRNSAGRAEKGRLRLRGGNDLSIALVVCGCSEETVDLDGGAKFYSISSLCKFLPVTLSRGPLRLRSGRSVFSAKKSSKTTAESHRRVIPGGAALSAPTRCHVTSFHVERRRELLVPSSDEGSEAQRTMGRLLLLGTRWARCRTHRVLRLRPTARILCKHVMCGSAPARGHPPPPPPAPSIVNVLMEVLDSASDPQLFGLDVC